MENKLANFCKELSVYRGKRVVVTGYQGFKGSWLCAILKYLGAEVYGFGHSNNELPNHHSLVFTKDINLHSRPGCLRYKDDIESFIDYANPDLVIHLAAKAIVAKTFADPGGTFENNVMGTVNLLDVCLKKKNLRGVVAVTSDKVYEDKNWQWGYRETDPLGGTDPYSVSKVCVEHVIRCYRNFGLPIVTARAGNVIGGGDWSYARLIPDIVRATANREPVNIHTMNATRPFQHVLDPLCGYLLIGARMLNDEGETLHNEYNFGPEAAVSVEYILETAKTYWEDISWVEDHKPTHPNMVYLLKIDSSLAKNSIGWMPMIPIEQAIAVTILWYKELYLTGRINTWDNISSYFE